MPQCFAMCSWLSFCRNFNQKPLKVCYKDSLSESFQQYVCSTIAIKYLSNDINIVAGDDPKDTDLQ